MFNMQGRHVNHRYGNVTAFPFFYDTNYCCGNGGIS